MPAHNRRLKQIIFTLDSNSFECQLRTWNLDPGVEDGDRMFTFCPDGEFTEETDPEPTLECVFFSDWRSGGISDFLWEHSGEIVAYEIVHHPDIPAEAVTFNGTLRIKPPPVGGDARATEVSEVTFQLQQTPTYTRGGP